MKIHHILQPHTPHQATGHLQPRIESPMPVPDGAAHRVDPRRTATSGFGRLAALGLLGLGLASTLAPSALAQSSNRGLGIAFDGIEVLRRNEPSGDEPYLLITQFRFRVDLAQGGIAPDSIRVATVTTGQDNLGRSHNDWANPGGIHRFSPVFAKDVVPRGEENWVFGALAVLVEEDASPGWIGRFLSDELQSRMESSLRSMRLSDLSPGTLIDPVIREAVKRLQDDVLSFDIGGIAEAVAGAVDPDDFCGTGLAVLKTGAGGSLSSYVGPVTSRLTSIAFAEQPPGTQDKGIDYTGDGHHRVHVRLPVLVPLDWTQTPAAGMGDVDTGPDGSAYFAGLNGTLWSTYDGLEFMHWSGSGFANVGVSGEGATLWGAGSNGYVWGYSLLNDWNHLPGGTNAVDVAGGRPGTVFMTRRDGTLWTSFHGSMTRDRVIVRARRVDADPFQTPWIAQTDGAVFKLTPTGWRRIVGPDAGRNVGVEDVAAGSTDNAVYVRRDGVVWLTPDGVTHHMVAGSGFRRVDIGPDNRVWAVGTNGTVWHFDADAL